jgi:hypothetical protein
VSDTSDLTLGFVVKVDGAALTEDQETQLVSVALEQAWSTVDRIEIRFDDRFADAPDFDVGNEITADIVDDAGTQGRVFSGEITARTARWNAALAEVVYEGYDFRHRLLRGITPATYKNSKFSDVIGTIAGNAGLQTGTLPNVLQRTVHEDLMFASSDFATLQQIARLTGTEWTIADKEITFVEKSAGSAVPLDSDQLFDVDIRFTPIERAKKTEVRGWDVKKRKAIVGTANHADANSKHQPSPKFGTTKALSKPVSPTAMSFAAGPVDQAQANAIASAIDRRLADTEVTGRGSTRGNSKIVPGAKIEIKKVSTRVNGTYTVMAANHVYGAGSGSLVTHFRIGSSDSSLASMLDDGTVQPHGRLTDGVTIGIVTNNKPEQEHPASVKVKLPYLSDKLETTWARLVSFGANKDRGGVFVPEVDDEVVVAFEHGDLNRPYILGTVWNDPGKAFGDVVKNGKVEERRVVSRLGTQLRYIDIGAGDDKSGFAVEVDDAKTRLFFGYKSTELVTKDRPMKFENGKASILLEKDEITIAANKITLKSDTGDVEIKAQNLKVEAKQKIEAKADLDVKIESSAMATLKAGGPLTVKGAMVKVN